MMDFAAEFQVASDWDVDWEERLKGREEDFTLRNCSVLTRGSAEVGRSNKLPLQRCPSGWEWDRCAGVTVT